MGVVWGYDWLAWVYARLHGRYDCLVWDMLGCLGDLIAWLGICSVAWDMLGWMGDLIAWFGICSVAWEI
ncbi:hypothetical protein [Sporosarcina sp. SG10008]|uniref:hypothetical protein n=1 Tax=Sporosarcina sp. SG10008 TaxID=3373103 RepID=UPI0037DC3F1C